MRQRLNPLESKVDVRWYPYRSNNLRTRIKLLIKNASSEFKYSLVFLTAFALMVWLVWWKSNTYRHGSRSHLLTGCKWLATRFCSVGCKLTWYHGIDASSTHVAVRFITTVKWIKPQNFYWKNLESTWPLKFQLVALSRNCERLSFKAKPTTTMVQANSNKESITVKPIFHAGSPTVAIRGISDY